jgi:hypothetical protein
MDRSERSRSAETRKEGKAVDEGNSQGKAREEPGSEPVTSQVRDARVPCERPDVVGECQATSDQILYQIKRSKEAAGGAAQ